MNPLVTVVSPAYNAEGDVGQLVECVRKQSVSELEHIVVDDGSSDRTLKVLRTLEKEHPNLRVVSQHNQGAGAARNKAISLAKGKYICFLDSDDRWADDKLEAQIGFMEQEKVAFSYGDYFEVDAETGELIVERKVPDRLTHLDLLKRCPIGCLTVAYNQEELGKMYMPSIKRGQDWALWLEITKRGVVARRYPGTKASYFVAKHSLSRNKIKKMENMYRIYRMQDLGPARSMFYLAVHSLHRIRK